MSHGSHTIWWDKTTGPPVYLHSLRQNIATMGSHQLRSAYIAILSVGLLMSCSYRLVRLEADNGKKTWVRFYKDADKRQEHQVRSIFKHEYKAKIYPRYVGAIRSGHAVGVKFHEYDTLRVNLAPRAYVLDGLFRTGVLSSSNFLCLAHGQCSTQNCSHSWTEAPGGQGPKDIGWAGPLWEVVDAQILDRTGAKGTQRRFLIHVTKYEPNPNRSAWVFEITNPGAGRTTPLEAFFDGAHLSFFTYAWTEV